MCCRTPFNASIILLTIVSRLVSGIVAKCYLTGGWTELASLINCSCTSPMSIHSFINSFMESVVFDCPNRYSSNWPSYLYITRTATHLCWIQQKVKTADSRTYCAGGEQQFFFLHKIHIETFIVLFLPIRKPKQWSSIILLPHCSSFLLIRSCIDRYVGWARPP